MYIVSVHTTKYCYILYEVAICPIIFLATNYVCMWISISFSFSRLDPDGQAIFGSQDEFREEIHVLRLDVGAEVEPPQDVGDDDFLLHLGEFLTDTVAGTCGKEEF